MTRPYLAALAVLIVWFSISPHVRAAAATPPLVDVVVTSTADLGTSGDGACTLREAIANANSAATAGGDTTGGDCALGTQIVFALPTSDPGYDAGTGTWTIRPQSALPAVTGGGITIDGYTQPGASPNTLAVGFDAVLKVVLDGSDTELFDNGFEVSSSGNTIRGFVIGGFQGNGVYIHGEDASANTISGNIIGLDATASSAFPNEGNGVSISNASGNTVGISGEDVGGRNVLSSNFLRGVDLSGFDARHNKVGGNYIGVNGAGTSVLGNRAIGVAVNGVGNVIGTNGDGVGDAVEGNVISGNTDGGINVHADSTILAGNLVGLDSAGEICMGNGGTGISMYYGFGVRVGTNGDGVSDTEERNVVSCSGTYGLYIGGSGSFRTAGLVVAGNYIGTDVTGTQARGNTDTGVVLFSLQGPVVGTNGDGVGDAAEGNLISGNGHHGIQISGGTGHTPHRISGNRVGTDASGTSPIPNAQTGIHLAVGTGRQALDLIGTDADGVSDDLEANTVAFNGLDGIHVSAGYDYAILGNRVFSNDRLGINLANDLVTPNDERDTDHGENNRQNFPVVTSAAYSTGGIEVAFTLNSRPNISYRVELFGSDEGDPVYTNGEGARFLGATVVTTNGDGDTSGMLWGPGTDPVVTMTATEIVAAGTGAYGTAFGSTSEFSAWTVVSGDPGGISFTVADPASLELTVPPEETRVFIKIDVTNTTAVGEDLDVWAVATVDEVPSFQRVVFGPKTVSVGAEMTERFRVKQKIPRNGNAASRTIRYTVYVGDYGAGDPMQGDGAEDEETVTIVQEGQPTSAKAGGSLDFSGGEIERLGSGDAPSARENGSFDGRQLERAVRLAPNPARSRAILMLSVAEPERVRVTVYDVTGRAVAPSQDHDLPAGAQTVSLDASGLSSGVYAVVVSGAGWSERLRMTVVR